MILALTLVLGATAGLGLCWLSARRDDHKAIVARPMPRRELPNAYYRAVNQ